MSEFDYMEYEALQAIRNVATNSLQQGQFAELSIDENGIADKPTRQAIADYLESLPFDNLLRYDMSNFDQALNEIELDYSLVDFVIGLIKRYQTMLLFAQLYWVQENGKQHPFWEKVLLDIPESNEDDTL